MTTLLAAIAALIAAFFLACLAGCVLWFALLIKHTPTDKSEDLAESDRDADVIKRASQPAPLSEAEAVNQAYMQQRRHVRAGSTWTGDV